MEECERLLVRASMLQCSSEAFFYLGKVQLQCDHSREELKSFQRAIDLAGEFFEALHEMGMAHSKLGEHAHALRVLQRAQRKNPHSPELFYNPGNVIHQPATVQGSSAVL